PLLRVVRLQPVSAGVLEALQVALEPAVVLIENAFFEVPARLVFLAHRGVDDPRPVGLAGKQEGLPRGETAAVDAHRGPFACCAPSRFCSRCATNASRSSRTASSAGSRDSAARS